MEKRNKLFYSILFYSILIKGARGFFPAKPIRKLREKLPILKHTSVYVLVSDYPMTPV